MSLAASQLFLFAGLLFLGLGSLTATLLVRAGSAQLMRWEPRARHRALVALSALPPLFALGLLFVATLPSFVALFSPGLDHCTLHDDGHAHLCFVHVSQLSFHTGLLVTLAFLITFFAFRAVMSTFAVMSALRVVRTLSKTGERDNELGITIIEGRSPLCFAAGLFRPQIVISRGLLGSLSQSERAVVLAHEQAHVRRRDALSAFFVRLLCVLHLPATARWLLNEVEVAAEQACDEEAALIVDRVSVAEAILSVERAASTQLGAVAVAFGARAVERRVESLLGEPARRPSLQRVVIPLGVAVACLLVLAEDLHHLTESLLSLILH